MKKEKEQSQGTINPTEKKYLIPQRLDLHHVELVEVTKEVYEETQKWINRERKKAQRRGECACLKAMLWQCDTNCMDCPYRRNINLSLDEVVYRNQEDGSEITLGETISDPSYEEQERIQALKDTLADLCAYLEEVDPKAMKLLQYMIAKVEKGEFESLRQIYTELGMPVGTFYERINKMKKFLKK